MYSFGGLRREADDGDILPPGITEQELLSVCIAPDLDSTTAMACLKELREQCLYLHFDGIRYCFKKDPNVTLLLEQEADMVSRDENRVRERIKEMLGERVAGHREAIVWPQEPAGIADRDPSFLIAYLPIEFGGKPRQDKDETAKSLFEKYGDKPRQYRNGIGLAVPAREQLETLRRAVRYTIAAEQVKGKARQLNLTDAQKAQLKEREDTEKASAESAFLKLYTEVWLPRTESGEIKIEKVELGGRTLQTTLDDKKRARVHDRVTELITQIQPRIFGSVTPTKIVELFRLGDGDPPSLGMRTKVITDGFYSFLGFTRLTNSAALRKGIARGIAEGIFGYTSGPVPTLGPDGKYEIPLHKVRYCVTVPDDEVDLESGFLIMPQAVPQPAPGPVQPQPEPDEGREPAPPSPTPGPLPQPGPSPQPPPGPVPLRTVELSFEADSQKLYTAWNAIANLAEIAGKVSVTIRAEKEGGFDKTRVENGVMEPLREADLID
jgi:hypothetical protein